MHKTPENSVKIAYIMKTPKQTWKCKNKKIKIIFKQEVITRVPDTSISGWTITKLLSRFTWQIPFSLNSPITLTVSPGEMTL